MIKLSTREPSSLYTLLFIVWLIFKSRNVLSNAHGTEKANAEGIATKGYLLSKGKRNKYGRGIYSTPSIKVAELYAIYEIYCWVKTVQTRLVKSNDLEIIPAESVGRPEVTGDYWLQEHEEYIQPYGICIKEY